MQRLLDLDARRPPELRANPRGVALDDRHVVRPQPLLVHFDAHLDARDSWRSSSSRSRDAPRAAGADVVRPARRRRVHQALVGVDDVAHVGDVAARVEIADAECTGGASPASIRAICRAKLETANVGALPRAGVIERPRDDDVEAVVAPRPAARAGPARASRGRTDWPARAARLRRSARRWPDRSARTSRRARGTAGPSAARPRAGGACRARWSRRCGDDVLPRRVDVRRAGQVIDARRLRRRARASITRARSRRSTACQSTCGEIRRASARPAGTSRRRGARSRQPIEQMAAGESRRAGDERRSRAACASGRRAPAAVLRLVVRAERRVLFLDRPPPPLVRAVPLDGGRQARRRTAPAAPSRARAACVVSSE